MYSMQGSICRTGIDGKVIRIFCGTKKDQRLQRVYGNRVSVVVLGGKREIMDMGSLTLGKESFLISKTCGAEVSRLGVFLETMNVYKELDFIDYIWKMGRKLCRGLEEVVRANSLQDYFFITGAECSPNFVI